MSYRGESPSKKLVRLEFWRAAEKLLAQRFYDTGTLSLASKEGGDIAVLLGMGVPLEHIHAVDTDHHAADAAQWKYNVKVHEMDVFEYAKSKKFGTVFLDFCGPLRESMIGKISNIVPRIHPGGVLGLGLLAGREQGTLASKVKEHLAENEDDSFLARVSLITNVLHVRRNKLVLREAWSYKSHTNDRYGKHMIVLLYQVGTERQPAPLAQLRKAGTWVYEADSSDLAAEGLKIVQAKKRADLLLNVTKQSIAAWKAHATRGTYK